MRGSSIYQQALKEIRRIEKAARRIAKRGYEFDLPFRKTKAGTEKTRYTRKELEYLQSIKGKDLYKYATYEGRSGEERRQEERREASRKAAETRRQKERAREQLERKEIYASINQTIIDNFLNRQNWHMLREITYEKLVTFIRSKVAQLGSADVANAIQEATSDGFVAQFQRSYDYQFTVNIMLFEQYFSDNTLSEIAEEQNNEEYLEYVENEEFEEYFR